MPACLRVTEKRQDLYQITFNLFIYPTIRPQSGETGRAGAQKVSVLFPHDLPLILKTGMYYISNSI